MELNLDWKKIKWRDSMGRVNPLIVKNFERSLKKLIRELNVDPEALDRIDLESLIDPTLTPEENLKIIADKLKLFSGPTDSLDTALTYLEMQLNYEREWCEELGWIICPETNAVREYRELRRLMKPRRPKRTRRKRAKRLELTLETMMSTIPILAYADPNAPPLKEPLVVPIEVWRIVNEFTTRYKP